MPELETSLYSVSLLNDDETPMEFVVHVLEGFFDMDWDTAKQKMLLIHHHGTAECGCYSYELARHIFPPPRVGKAPHWWGIEPRGWGQGSYSISYSYIISVSGTPVSHVD